MFSIRDNASAKDAIRTSTDPQLRSLLSTRLAQLTDQGSADLRDRAHFFVVEPGDSLAAIDGALGFPVTANFADQVRYGQPGFTPSWEWIERHGDWFELAFVLSDDGFGWVVLVRDRHDTEPILRAMCAEYAPGL